MEQALTTVANVKELGKTQLSSIFPNIVRADLGRPTLMKPEMREVNETTSGSRISSNSWYASLVLRILT